MAYNGINRPHAIHPNETVGAVPVCPPERPRSGVSIRKWMNTTTYTSGAEMHRALPPPLLKIKKCVYRYSFGVIGDDAICFKTSYSFGVTVAEPWPLPPGLLPPGLPEPLPLPEPPLPEPPPWLPLPEPLPPEPPPFFFPPFFALGTSDSATCTNFFLLTFTQTLAERPSMVRR